MQEKPEHHENEANILRMAHIGIRTGDGQFALSLGLIKDLPCGRDQQEATRMKTKLRR